MPGVGRWSGQGHGPCLPHHPARRHDGDGGPPRDIPRYVALHEDGRLPIERLLSGHVRLDDLNAAFDKLADGSVVRQVVTF